MDELSSVKGTAAPVSEGSQTVVVTGGSGFLGSWAIVDLLQRGHQVRTTVRHLSRSDDVRKMVTTQCDPAHRLTFVEANLLSDQGWGEVMNDAAYVLHVASPMPIGEYRGQDVITPAREGTLRVLNNALLAGVKRVVITSSTAAAAPPADAQGVVADETVWTDLPDEPAYNYPRAKTLAEQDAWSFVAEHPELELATVLPGQIQGPVLGRDYSASVQMIAMMLTGKMPALPRIGFSIVDVRDLVDLHLRAMTSPAAAGERFIAAGEFLWFSDVAKILRDALGPDAAKVPTRRVPDFVVRLGARFNAELNQLRPNLGLHQTVTSAKAERLLDWRPRPAANSIVDSANSLISQGLV